jgi:hypothetical protein
VVIFGVSLIVALVVVVVVDCIVVALFVVDVVNLVVDCVVVWTVVDGARAGPVNVDTLF